jgi:hypothetical protein
MHRNPKIKVTGHHRNARNTKREGKGKREDRERSKEA